MGWPTQADYRDALQNPDAVFTHRGLKTSRAEVNKLGVPRARSGAFASVYKMEGPNGTLALKLFNFASADRERRYKAVEDHFRALDKGPGRPPCLVSCKYDPKGIRLGNDWYPVQTMDWVKGHSLAEWLRQAVGRKDKVGLRAAADAWADVLDQLRAAKIAHGDLQHDNVMVVQGELKLVDYDGMCVPGLEGADQLEFGKPAYQHPGRADQKLNLGLDHFPAWVILVALRAFAADLTLYDRFVTKLDNENILFREEDLKDPKQSTLWPVLLKSADREVARWAEALWACVPRPFATIPRFEMAPPDQSPAVDTAIKRKDWVAVAAADPACCRPDLGPVIARARERVAARDKLLAAYTAGDLRAGVAAYRPDLLDDWTAAFPLCQWAKKAKDQTGLLDQLAAAAKVPGNDQALVALWDQSAKALEGVAAAATYRDMADTWRARLAAVDHFRTATRDPKAADKAVAEAWAGLEKVGSHPSVTREERERATLAVRRRDILGRLAGLAPVPSEEADQKRVRLGDELAAAGGTLAPAAKALYDAAKERLAVLARVATAVQAADKGGSEAAVVGAAKTLPPGYVHKLADRVRRAAAFVSLSRGLAAALDATPQSDRAIAAAWETFQAQPGGARPQPAATVERCQLAVQRRDALRELEQIDGREKAADRQDVRWLQGWKTHRDLLLPSEDREAVRPRLELAGRRFKAWQALKLGLETSDLKNVRRLAADPELKGYPPVVQAQEQIAELTARAAEIDRLLDRLRTNKSLTLTAADLAFLRENHDFFGPEVKDHIRRRVEERLKNGSRLQEVHPAFQVVPGNYPRVQVNWGWPDFDLLTWCVVGQDRRRPPARPEDVDRTATGVCHPSDYRRGNGGFQVPLLAGAGPLYVSVWPVVDLGWAEVTGPPLHVGPVPPTGAGGRAG